MVSLPEPFDRHLCSGKKGAGCGFQGFRRADFGTVSRRFGRVHGASFVGGLLWVLRSARWPCACVWCRFACCLTPPRVVSRCGFLEVDILLSLPVLIKKE